MDKFVYEDFSNIFIDTINKAKENSFDIIEYLSDTFVFQSIIMFIRLRISSQIIYEKEFYVNYFDNEQDLINFCRNEVERINAEADEIQISVLNKIFEIPFRIY